MKAVVGVTHGCFSCFPGRVPCALEHTAALTAIGHSDIAFCLLTMSRESAMCACIVLVQHWNQDSTVEHRLECPSENGFAIV